MNPLELKQLEQKQKEKELQDYKFAKISNSLLECFIQKRNIIAIKIIFYFAIKQGNLQFKKVGEYSSLTLSISDLSAIIKTDRKTILRNLKSMQETSIEFVQKTPMNTYITTLASILPMIEYETGKDTIEVLIFNKVLELVIDVKNRFTVLNVENLVNLKSINTIKMIGLLKIIDNYSSSVAKKKAYSLEMLNGLFGVNYKNYYEFERKVLKPVQEELDKESQLTFIYNFNFEVTGRGRPPIKEVILYLKDNHNRQLTMF